MKQQLGHQTIHVNKIQHNSTNVLLFLIFFFFKIGVSNKKENLYSLVIEAMRYFPIKYANMDSRFRPG